MWKLVRRDTTIDDEEQGQGLAEYGLVLSFIALIGITALSTLGSSVATMLNMLSGFSVVR